MDQKPFSFVKLESTLEALFTDSPAFMAFLSLPDFRFVISNKSYDKLMGRSDLIGKTVLEAVPEVEAQGFIDLLKSVVDTKQPYHAVEREIFLKQGAEKSRYFLDFTYYPVINNEGEIYGVAVQGYDVTEKVLSRTAVENERQNFRTLFKQTPEMVCILRGPEHVFEFVNEAHIKALGFDATGMKVRVAQPESVEVHGILDDVYNTGITAELHEIPVTVTDRIRYFNLTYAPRKGFAGEITGIMILGVEVTDQVLSRQKMNLALSAAKMGTYQIDLLRNHFYPSMETEEIFGQRILSGDLLEAVKRSVHPDDLEKTIANTFTAIEEKRPYSDEFRVIREDGNEAWVLSQGEAIYDDKGKPVSFYGVIQDITQRKQIELKLNEAVRARDEFLSIASHELKTPVTSMKLQLQMTERSLHEKELSFTGRLARTIEVSIKQINKLTSIIDDLLDVSKINMGRLSFNFEETDLKDLIEDIIERFQIQFKNSGCEVTFHCEDENIIAECDRFRIDQVVTNLFTNVTKYGAGKPVIISLQKNGSYIQVIVQDFGMGIEKTQHARIFERFERSVQHNNISGLGLGLFISKIIVDAHGGCITVNSEPGVGSTFVVEIPQRLSQTFTQ